MATYEITAEMVLKPVIAEVREVAQALNKFADDLERIDAKYSVEAESESCNTCKNNDDEFSGECYECVKNIQNHYETKRSEPND